MFWSPEPRIPKLGAGRYTFALFDGDARYDDIMIVLILPEFKVSGLLTLFETSVSKYFGGDY